MSDTTERARLRSTLVDALNGRPNIDRDQAWDILAEWDKVAALAAELAAAEKRNEELERLIEELGDTQLAGTLPADIRTGAGGACGRHGVFDGLVCPKCAASEGKP